MTETSKILIVDDRSENLLVLEQLLDEPHLNIVSASSGEEALSQMLEDDFALVLMDVQMPGMDGFETAELMRGNKRTRHVPIIFVSAISQEDKHVFKGYDSGAVDYLFKPFDPVILRSKVDVFIELDRQRNELHAKTLELNAKVEELKAVKRQLENMNEKLLALSSQDGLTGIPNRRRFDEYLSTRWQRAQETESKISLILLDLDHFKDFNDLYGHVEGDVFLKKAATTLASSLDLSGFSDYLVARYGGEEFVAVIPDVPLEAACDMANTIRANIEKLRIPHKNSPSSDFVTASLGVVCLQATQQNTPHQLIECADKAMYEAKQSGRNRTVCYEDQCNL